MKCLKHVSASLLLLGRKSIALGTEAPLQNAGALTSAYHDVTTEKRVALAICCGEKGDKDSKHGSKSTCGEEGARCGATTAATRP